MELQEKNGIELSAYERLAARNEALEKEILRQELEINGLSNRIEEITSSKTYRVALKAAAVLDKLMPKNSLRREAVKFVIKGVKGLLKGNGREAAADTPMDRLERLGKYARMDIVADDQTLLAAKRMKAELERAEIQCEIHMGKPQAYEPIPYMLLCPENVSRFPEVYFVFHTNPLEREMLTEESLSMLRNACGILEYSLENIRALSCPQWKELSRSIFYLPLDPGADDAQMQEEAFSFYFQRFLLAHDRIDFDAFYRLCGGYVRLGSDRICLNLPESILRRRFFDMDNRYGFVCFPGLRHRLGWVGCGMSYKMIFLKAMEEGLEKITICEDDVIFPEDFARQFEEIERFLEGTERWSAFSGVMADVGDVKVRRCWEENGGTIAEIDHMISMVLNIYHKDMFACFRDWDEKNRDVRVNAIDRYLESKDLSVFVRVPFLAGHKEELTSTIWGFANTQYADMIAQSEAKLKKMIEASKDGCPTA